MVVEGIMVMGRAYSHVLRACLFVLRPHLYVIFGGEGAGMQKVRDMESIYGISVLFYARIFG